MDNTIKLILFFLLLSINSWAGAPTRQATYTPNTTIASTDVTSNENVIFNYLQAGVDTYAAGSITNTAISSSANIQSDKLNLASIGQTMAMSGKIFKFTQGATVASAATITLGEDGNFFIVSGTTAITSITAKEAGTLVIIDFSEALTLTDGSNLKLAGNFTTTADDTITLISDGTNWIELARSVN